MADSSHHNGAVSGATPVPAAAEGEADKPDAGGAQRAGRHRERKKYEVIRLAQADPFMSVDEIAAQVHTTARYVRTILSEAGLSLLALRRRYARQMERRLGLDIRVAHGGKGLLSALTEAGNRLEVRRIRVAQVTDPELAEWLGVSPTATLLEISRVRVVNGRPLYVNQVVTSRDLTVNELILTDEGPLRETLGLGAGGEIEFDERTLDVVPASQHLAECLEAEVGAPILRAGNVLRVGNERVGIEFNYFDATRVRLVLEGVPDYALRIVERRQAEWSGTRPSKP